MMPVVVWGLLIVNQRGTSLDWRGALAATGGVTESLMTRSIVHEDGLDSGLFPRPGGLHFFTLVESEECCGKRERVRQANRARKQAVKGAADDKEKSGDA